jgi:hypothetical protein
VHGIGMPVAGQDSGSSHSEHVHPIPLGYVET